jgi:hypothetical protein
VNFKICLHLANLPNFFTFQFLHWPRSSKICFYFELLTPPPPPPKKKQNKKTTKKQNKTNKDNKQTNKHVKTGVRCSLARFVPSEISGNPNNYNYIKQTQKFAIVNWNWCYVNNEN